MYTTYRSINFIPILTTYLNVLLAALKLSKVLHIMPKAYMTATLAWSVGLTCFELPFPSNF